MFLKARSWLPRGAIEFYDRHRFEAATAWGLFWQRHYTGIDLDYLQVGSYETHLPGFLNTDHFVNRAADFHVDIRYPLPFANDRWVGIFAHHTVEHISYPTAMVFFREAHRCLRSGGVLRAVVPDVAKFIMIYAGKADDRMRALEGLIPSGHLDSVNPKTPLGFVNWAYFSTIGNEHRSAWDFETMSCGLSEAGFRRVELSQCGRSLDPRMCGIDNQRWAEHSLYVEAVK